MCTILVRAYRVTGTERGQTDQILHNQYSMLRANKHILNLLAQPLLYIDLSNF